MRWENRDPTWLVTLHPWLLLAFAIAACEIVRLV
jgi:hypothetical protein